MKTTFSHIWIHSVCRYTVMCCLSAILIVSAHSFVEVSFAGNEVSELGGNAVDSGNRVVESGKLFFVPVLVDGVEADKFIAAKTSEDSSNSPSNSDKFSGHDAVSFQWAICYIFTLVILMILSWGLGLWVFYYFTQRRAGRDRRY